MGCGLSMYESLKGWITGIIHERREDCVRNASVGEDNFGITQESKSKINWQKERRGMEEIIL